MAFCYWLFHLNLRRGKALSIYRQQKQYGLYYLFNGLILLGAVVIGILVQRAFFFNGNRVPGGIAAGYLARFALSTVLIAIIIKLILLMREGKSKEVENEQLKNAYMLAELELLKEQITFSIKSHKTSPMKSNLPIA
jgi:hypothetical protein